MRKEFAEKNEAAIDAFLVEYEASIKYLNANPADAAALIVKHGIFANQSIAQTAIPKCNVTFMKGDEMKAAMSSFITAMYNIAPASVGNKIPEADFYYIP